VKAKFGGQDIEECRGGEANTEIKGS